MSYNTKSPIRVLHIVGAMYPGGMGNYIMNLYRCIDKERIRFDFIIHARKENDYVEQLREMGSEIYVLPRLTRHPLENLGQIKEIVKENKIDVVIRHTANALITPQLLAAKRGGAYSICHSHSSTDPMRLAHNLGRLIMKPSTDERWACSVAAGLWMYGNLDYKVINNAIDLEEFEFSEERRKRVREELSISDNAHVYGHVGNFSDVKNHTYLLKIYREILNRDKNSFLVLVGEGMLRKKIEEETAALGLTEHVILTGIRKDVSSVMSALDLLIFPSVYEGLPLTLIEAQATGLPCIISDTITDEVAVTEGLVRRLSIQADPGIWADMAYGIADAYDCKKEDISEAEYKNNSLLLQSLYEYRKRPEIKEEIRRHGYDLKALGEWFENHILEITES